MFFERVGVLKGLLYIRWRVIDWKHRSILSVSANTAVDHISTKVTAYSCIFYEIYVEPAVYVSTWCKFRFKEMRTKRLSGRTPRNNWYLWNLNTAIALFISVQSYPLQEQCVKTYAWVAVLCRFQDFSYVNGNRDEVRIQWANMGIGTCADSFNWCLTKLTASINKL